MKYTGIFVCLCLISFQVFSQKETFPLETPVYPFIDYSKNRIELFNDSAVFKKLFDKFDSLVLFGNENLRIVHIGGSHIQADMYTQQIRRRFESFQPGILGSRGFIFPYTVAKTNNPKNYRVEYSGNWTMCKNTYPDPCNLGMSGISVTTRDSISSVKIILNNDSLLYFDFNRIKVFHPFSRGELDLKILSPENCTAEFRLPRLGFTEFKFDYFPDSIEFKFVKTDTSQTEFILQGFSFENDDQGLVYNTIGVNGARTESFLRCEFFGTQLAALKPDLVILSLGTNDGNTRHFNGELYKNNYVELIKKINTSAPEAAILITVPNDCYLFRRYANRNTEEIKKIIFDIARRKNFGVWDFYSVMGGFNSSFLWHSAGLMNNDRIHFNKAGYEIQGDLFFLAFLNTWDNFLKNK